MYGYELVLDVYECDPATFTRVKLKEFFERICVKLNLAPEELHWWDYDNPAEKAAAPAHLKGTSAVQFISTSSLVIHALDDLRTVFVNLFSCGECRPDIQEIEAWVLDFFEGGYITCHLLERGGKA